MRARMSGSVRGAVEKSIVPTRRFDAGVSFRRRSTRQALADSHLDGDLRRVCRFHIVRICRINKGADRRGKEAQQQR
jgi:hypothetical protein